MNTTTTSAAPRTAPYVAGAVFLAILVIIGLHFSGFHFVVAAGS